MCSITDPRLAIIGTAIDELAEAARAEAARAGATQTEAARAEAAQARPVPDTMAGRVAGIWAMVAELDPGLAWRLAQYTDPEPTARD
jgi:hypothetical protein